ncbi:phosphatidate phosphatase PAH2 isoform X2 [Cryptomeria japonica]|uniref:phosphatidate phosphatase PAH2 isoform X2 n=1 Tax=Cryptomeria japonica TaxID=3369 RepID=UPI0027DA5D89|nr:phosphatidate phosphatase PAH2 isoform X2 [Cryptomeria japonica]
MDRFGDYIIQGVGTVAGPLQPFGGAVDIIVVEQPDGSFRSTPWYVKFGKVLGVIRRTEKIVDVAVNGQEANFHMYLNRSGHAYFLNEVESIQEELNAQITADAMENVQPIKDGFLAIKATNEIARLSSETCSKVTPANDNISISWKRKLARKRLRQLRTVIGLMFRYTAQSFSNPKNKGKRTPDRVALLEMAELAAELLERKWCTGYSQVMQPKKQMLDDDEKAGAQFQNNKTQTDDSEVLLVSADGHVTEVPVSSLDEHLDQTPAISSFHDQVIFTKSDPDSSAQCLKSCPYDNILVDNTIYNDGLIENSDSQFKLSIFESVYDIHGNQEEQNGNLGNLNQKNGTKRKDLYDTVPSLQEVGVHHFLKSKTTEMEVTQSKDIVNGSKLDSSHGIKFREIQIPSNCVPGRQEHVVTSSISMQGHHSFNAESTEISVASLGNGNERENPSDCMQHGTGKSTPQCSFLLLEGVEATAAVQAFDHENVCMSELNCSGIDELESVIAADHIQASESKRQPGRQKAQTNTPTSEQLSSLNLKGGPNIITFTFVSSVFGKQQVEARIYLWKWNTRIVISDVDGTITKSDVLGHVMPWVGKDWSHLGVARLFSAIKDNGYQLLFLSARAISQAHGTRQFLLNLKQEGETLPDGPIVISPDGLFPSLYREVIRRTPHEFKIACLKDIKALFPSDSNPFYAGFGNRITDEISYLKVGVPKGKVFTINPKGEVAVNHFVDVKSYTSLHNFVDRMFPSMPSSQHEDFNTWNYWKVPLLSIED